MDYEVIRDERGIAYVKQLIPIPGRPATVASGDFHAPPTHLEVHTSKSGQGIETYALEVSVTSDGGTMFGSQSWGNHAARSMRRATEKNLLAVHAEGLAKLKELRPELFPPAPGDMVKRHTPVQGAPNPSFKVLEVRDGILVTEQGNVPASDYMVVHINEVQPA